MSKKGSSRSFIILLAIFLIGVFVTRVFVSPTKQVFQKQTEKVNEVKSSSTQASFEASSSSESSLLVMVTKVIDGDTIEIEGGQRVRYIGMDSPESHQGVECFSNEATSKNKELVLGKKVSIEKDVSETDRYQRLLRYVWVDDVMVNELMVKEGYAKVSTFPSDVKYKDKFLAAEQFARENNKGFWSMCGSVAGSAINTEQSPGSSSITPTSGNQVQSASKNTTSNTTSSSSLKQTTPTAGSTSSPPSSTCNIKGNISSGREKIYHLPDCGSYEKTKIDESTGERLFCSEQEALDAGWRKAKNCP